MKKVASLFLAIVLGGCAFHRTPYITYGETRSQSDTAVFAAFVQNSPDFVDARIRAVDGKETSCVEAGCPYWARVIPGSHIFLVRYTSHYQLIGPVISAKVADLPIEISEMKPLHVYVARYTENNGRVAVKVEDLGIKPDFGITLGLEGVNKKYYPVEF